MWRTLLKPRIFRDPGINDSGGGIAQADIVDDVNVNELEAGSTQDAQPDDTGTEPESTPEYTNSYFQELQDRVKSDPSSVNDVDDKTLDAYNDWIMGKKFPGGEENKDLDNKQPEKKKDDEPEKAEVDPDLQELFDITGTKDAKSAAAAVKGMRKTMTGQNGETVARIKRLEDQLNSQGSQASNEQPAKDVGTVVPIEDMLSVKSLGLESTLDENFQLKPELVDEIADKETSDTINSVVQAMKKGFDAIAENLKPLATLQETAEVDARIAKDMATFNLFREDLLELSDKFPEVYGTDKKALTGALQKYFKGDGFDPILAPFDELLLYQNENKLPSAMSAHKDKFWDSAETNATTRAKDAAAAAAVKERQNSELTGHKASVALGGQDTGADSNGEFTPSQINDILEGRAQQPENWYDADDMPIFANMPASVVRHFKENS